ncbi:MAG: hypothetical protein OHK0026_11230 [Rhodocyclaceae bacterium]
MTSTHDTLTLNPDECYSVMQQRDKSFDGAFVVAVRTTRIYCRPSCPSKLPRRENVHFYPIPQAAEAAGYRACKRCKPQSAAPLDPGAALARDICAYIDSAESIPTLEELGEQFGYSPHHLQRAFKSVMGVSPRDYADARRAQRLKAELRAGEITGVEATVTDALYSAGYGSSSRLYESTTLGMTPATYKQGGAGALIHYGLADSPLGRLLVAATERGVCGVALGDDDAMLIASLHSEYPAAQIAADDAAVADYITAIVAHLNGWQPALDLPLDVRGTAFQARVWAALALSRRPGTSSPRLPGPSTRIRCGRAASSIFAFRLPAHRRGASVMPGVSTMAARVPMAPSFATRPGIVRAGVAIRARSGGAGRWLTSRQASTPWTAAYFGLTGKIRPAKPHASMLRITTKPGRCSRTDAPRIATERGWKR